MALSRRTGARFQGSIWPGFVDAMTGLLLVLMFVLTIFMIVQFILTERISGQETELDALSVEVAALARALGVEERSNSQLEARLSALSASLNDVRDEAAQQQNLIARLTSERDNQAAALETAAAQITDFEAQVAALLSQRDAALGQVADLQNREVELLSAQEALNNALAGARDEIDAQTEAARLAAAQREVLDALILELRKENKDADGQIASLRAEVARTAQALTAEETARLAEGAAAEALRARLETADAELTAMTLTLEEERRKAEETLTLLAAARAVEGDLNAQLAQALLLLQTEESNAKTANETATTAISELEAEIATLELLLAETQAALNNDRDSLGASLATAQQDAATLRSELATTRETLLAERDELSRALAASEARIEALTGQLNDTQDALTADRDTLRSDLSEARREIARLRAQLLASEETLVLDREALKAQLVEALAAKLAAETLATDKTTEVERREALLAQANKALSNEEAVSAEAQRQTELLNQQVAELRSQLTSLQGLLDDAKGRDAEREIELQSLGSDLNTALARVAAEESRRAALEEAERKRLEEEAKDLEKYRSEFFGRLRVVLENQDGVRIEGDRFVFSSEVLFPPGDVVLSADGQNEIAKVAKILRDVASEIPEEIDWVIRVDGHTDDVPLSGLGEFADNWELSQARALSVVKYMVNFLGIPPDRLAANGFGQFQPVAFGDSDAARALNRRIELKFTEK